MAGRMTEAEKKAVPRSERGVPGKSGTGSYPMPNARHARSAVAFAAMHHGSNSAFTNRIRAKARSLGFLKGSKPTAHTSSQSQRGNRNFYGD
jgi:hypothetical protein